MKDENNEPDLPVPEPQELLVALHADLPVHLSFEVRNPRAYAAIVAASEAWPPIPEAYTRKLETTVYAVDTVTFTDGEGGEVDLRGCVWSTDQGFMIKAPDGPKGQGVLSVGIWDESERERLHLAAFDARNRRLKMKKPRSLGRFGGATANESHVWLTDSKATDTLELLKSNLPITLFFGFPEESFQALGDQARDWEVGPSEAFDTVVFQQAIGEGESARASKTYTLQGVLWGTPNGVMLVSGKSGLRLDYRQSGPPENSISHGHLVTELHRRNRRKNFTEPPYLGVTVDAESHEPRTTLADIPKLFRFDEEIPQSTFQEVRAPSLAVIQGPIMDNWRRVEGDIALVHSPKDSRHETRFEGRLLLQWWDFELSYETLENLLQNMGPDAALMLNLCTHMALKDDREPVTLDEMIRALGWNVRNNAHRVELRRVVWAWATCFSSMSVYGSRFPHENFKDEMTGKKYKGTDVTTRSPLFWVSQGYAPGQQPKLDGSEPPLFFTVAPGDFLARYRKDARILTYLGNLRKIAAIPGGKAAGAWARAYGFTLHQLWREAASKGKSVIVTREELHRHTPSEPYIHELLEGNNPKRAIEYDRDAWVYLYHEGIISNDPKSLAFDYDPKKRKGWAEAFLVQSLTVLPGTEIEMQVRDIRERTLSVRKSRGKRA